mgnify:CR=1 FL=1
MFDEIEFERMKRLPNYVFAEVNNIKMEARRAGEDIIDFSMGNPDGPAPQHIIDKLKVFEELKLELKGHLSKIDDLKKKHLASINTMMKAEGHEALK